jgi:hypothetical protein
MVSEIFCQVLCPPVLEMAVCDMAARFQAVACSRELSVTRKHLWHYTIRMSAARCPKGIVCGTITTSLSWSPWHNASELSSVKLTPDRYLRTLPLSAAMMVRAWILEGEVWSRDEGMLQNKWGFGEGHGHGDYGGTWRAMIPVIIGLSQARHFCPRLFCDILR